MFKVPYTKIVSIGIHDNANSLEIAKVYDFNVVVKKGQYKAGDLIVFVPIDSILPLDLELQLFPITSKIKLSKSRVKQIRIRNFPSQGMLISTDDVATLLKSRGKSLRKPPKEEEDLAELLGITKFEPPEPSFKPRSIRGKKARKTSPHPLFHSFNGVENIKWYPNLFKEEDEIIIQEKIHGSNIRCALLPSIPDTLWKKVLNFFKLLSKYEYRYGSNNVDITGKSDYSGYYGEDVYGNCIKKYELFSKLQPGEIFYGELIGAGIQKGYNYGHESEHGYVLFDVKKFEGETWKWLNPDEVEKLAKERGIPFVPILFRGKFNKETVQLLVKGDSVYCSTQKVREGIVIKSVELNNGLCPSQKKMLKWISEDYLDNNNNTDFH